MKAKRIRQAVYFSGILFIRNAFKLGITFRLAVKQMIFRIILLRLHAQKQCTETCNHVFLLLYLVRHKLVPSG